MGFLVTMEQVIQNFTTAIELDPDNISDYNNRGVAYNRLGNSDLAIQDFSKAIDLAPDLAIAYGNRGKAHKDAGNFEQAIEDLARYLELAPDAPDREVVINFIEQMKSELAE